VIVGVDVGGTFTDIVIVEPQVSQIRVVKTLTDVEDPSSKIVEVVPSRGDVEIMHATTLTSNILLGQTKLMLPKVLLVTNRGFGDLVHIGRQNRTELYSLKPRRAKIPGTIEIVEVDERTLSTGFIERSVSPSELELLRREIESRRPDIVCICLLNSYINPESEKILKSYIVENVKNIDVVCSHEIAPSCREYERFCTTIVSSLLRPLVRRYVERLVAELARRLENFQLYMATSWGGTVHPDECVRRPVILLESGPAAGVVACSKLCRELGLPNAIAFDMGGTTAKFSPIVNYEPEIRDEYEIVSGVHGCRIQRRVGIPIMVEMLDIVEVSAGGGTVVWTDEAGSVRVGPMSVGADPGPACYGRGGESPTVTDANLVLGRIYPRSTLGELKVSRELAVNVFKKLKDITGMDIEEIAYSAIRKINHEMSRGIKIATVERGLDPRDFTLITYGGAGPLHACELAEDLGISRIVVPQYSGVFTALGLTCMDLTYRYEIPIYHVLHDLSIENLYEDLFSRASKLVSSLQEVSVEYVLCMRYVNQDIELKVRLEAGDTVEKLKERFERRYRREFGYNLENMDIEVTRAIVIIRRESTLDIFKIIRRSLERKRQRDPTIDRIETFIRGSWTRCPVLDRRLMYPGYFTQGPAIVVDNTCTIFLNEGWELNVDNYGNIVMVRK